MASFFHLLFDPLADEVRGSLGWEAAAALVSRCTGDANGDGTVTVDEIVRAVDEALAGCSGGVDRFVDHGAGTIADRATGLVWEKKGRSGVVHADQRYTFGLDRLRQDGTLFTSFLPALNRAQWGGHSDWRVPRVHEWLTIIDTDVPARGLRPPFWTDWSATGYIDDGVLAWRPQGLDSTPAPETERLSARAVRGPLWTGIASRSLCPADASGDGQVTVDEIIATVDDALSGCPAPAERLVDNGDGTLSDRLTGLMWQRKEQIPGVMGVDAEYTWCSDVDADERCDDPSAPPDGTLFTEFLPMVNALAIGGHQDWRLPTLEEAEDFVLALDASAGRVQPIAGCDPLCVFQAFQVLWTARTAPDDASYALVVALDGAIVPVEKARPLSAWAVRQGS